MKLYWIESERRYVHRLSDVPKGVEAETRDIPTDLAGLMGHLNFLHEDLAKWKDMAERSPEQFEPDHPAPSEVQLTTSAPCTLGLGVQLDVEEAIQNATPRQLASYASNVCWRMEELAREK